MKHQIQIILIDNCTIDGETEKVSYRVDRKYSFEFFMKYNNTTFLISIRNSNTQRISVEQLHYQINY